MGREQLIREAEAAEELAKMISSHPDKDGWLDLAARLRDAAATMEERSWTTTVSPLHAQTPQRLDH
ncbi:hypothetical protein LJR225_000421 [Phenylobacterium sp. LjRoot225]|uniref:hypothetical protein n=1 Tax=Phenylobacterium sp. LjRoot225 TaxID=3342285 RepID=UPI003ECE121D